MVDSCQERFCEVDSTNIYFFVEGSLLFMVPLYAFNMVAYLQPSGQAVVDLKWWFQNNLLKDAKVLPRSPGSFYFAFLREMRSLSLVIPLN